MSNLCLAVDRVIEILMRYHATGDWGVTLQTVFPLAMVERNADEKGRERKDDEEKRDTI